MLKLFLALALVIGSIQCAAACTPVECAQPPCHHHKQAPACSHELIPATIVQATTTAVSFPSEAIEASAINPAFAPIQTSPAQDPSPPGALIPPRTILRI